MRELDQRRPTPDEGQGMLFNNVTPLSAYWLPPFGAEPRQVKRGRKRSARDRRRSRAAQAQWLAQSRAQLLELAHTVGVAVRPGETQHAFRERVLLAWQNGTDAAGTR